MKAAEWIEMGENIRACDIRIVERIALLLGCSSERAAEIGEESMARFEGRKQDVAFADELMNWIVEQAG